MRALLAIVRKDLTVEGRTRELVPAMLLLALLLLTVASAAGMGRAAAPAVLWVAVLFSASLGLARSFHQETEHEPLSGVALTPVDPAVVFAGKALANLVLVLGTSAVVLGAAAVLFNIDLPAAAGPLLAVVLLGVVGVVALGTLLAGMLAAARIREALLPLLLLPLAIPGLVAAAGATEKALAGAGWPALLGELQLLAAFAAAYIALPVLVFDFVMRE